MIHATGLIERQYMNGGFECIEKLVKFRGHMSTKATNNEKIISHKAKTYIQDSLQDTASQL